MTQLTEAQRKAYLESDGTVCPICGSVRTAATDDIQAEAGIAWQKVECQDCGAEFEDLYELVSVRGSEDPA